MSDELRATSHHLISRRERFPYQVGNWQLGAVLKKVETDARLFSCPCRKSYSGGRSAVLKNKNGRCDMQSKVQIDQALPQLRQPRLGRPRQQ